MLLAFPTIITFDSMTNFDEHINFRLTRYKEFIQKPHFNQDLKGLHHIELNVAETCTRKCSFCPRGNPELYPNQRKFMDVSTFENFLNGCIKDSYKEEIHFTGFGESLCHPNILELLSLIKAKQMQNYFVLTTNGDLLKKIDPTVLYDLGISHITISCYDGIDSYNSFVELMQSTNKSFFVRKLWDPPTSEFLQTNEFLDRTNRTPKQGKCYIPFYKMFIDYDGRVLLCSNDWFRKANIELNINTHSLKDIWYDRSLQEYRASLIQGKRNMSPCSSCSVTGTLMGKESAEKMEPTVGLEPTTYGLQNRCSAN